MYLLNKIILIFFTINHNNLKNALFVLVQVKNKILLSSLFLNKIVMPLSKIAGIGMYIPERVVTNQDLTRYMDTNDEWIQERTGIKERHYAHRTEETTTTMAIEAAKIAIERAGITAQDVDFIVFATLSPDYFFPGCGVLVQRELKMQEIGALDIRNQCSGFVYALSVADQFFRFRLYYSRQKCFCNFR